MKRRKKEKKSIDISVRYSIASLSVLTICIAVFTLLQFVFMDDIFLLAAKIDMRDVAERIQEVDFSDEDYKILLSDYEASHNVYVEIYSPGDNLIYTSRENESVYTGVNDSENGKVLKPRIMKFLSHSDNADGSYFEIRQEYFATAQYLVYGSFFGEDKSLVMFYPIDVIKDNARTASIALFTLSVFAFALITGLMLCIGKLFSMPLKRVTATTKKIANMNFDETCPSFKFKDLDELSASINILSDSLSKSLDALKSKNKQLEDDIAAERKQAKERRSFIANLSHELKTPISIILGYAEGMKLGIGCDSTDEFCDIIIEEANKMNDLILRLMEYMNYNSATYKSNISRFNVYDLLWEICDSRSFQFKEKGIKLFFDINPDFEGSADTILVETIFNNYLSNALSHADYEKEIYVSSEERPDCYRIKVFNTGDPIPGTDIENIWNSFYRADKSHSRAEGRFGLGLSIVASMQEIMNRDYGVINKEKGVEFWFDITKAYNAQEGKP
ncbi:MAG: HAMP domain-containing sensor histidine kinase [Oscillospiraceae bacterium]|nr:HAMP domain-containing sensor histidine kinase [Oscillospiraceae bacterium]